MVRRGRPRRPECARRTARPYGAGPGAYAGPPSSDSGAGAGGDTRDGGNNKGILIGVGALVAIVVLALGAFMFLGGDDETEAAGSGASTGDGSMTAPYSNVVPAYVRDNAKNCREAEATITSYDTGVADRTVPGMRCRGADGSLLEGNNIELIDDDEFARGSTEQARTMDYEIIKEEGGVTLIAAAYSGGSSKIYWADENEGISLELYPYDNLEEAKAAAEQMK